jgi:hypothetical protein
MALRLVQVNFKAREDSELGRFWAVALGWGVSSEGPGVTNVEPVGFAWPDAAAVCVDVVTVPDPDMVRYRAHLDLATTSAAHQKELVAHLVELGATPADVGQGARQRGTGYTPISATFLAGGRTGAMDTGHLPLHP